MSDIMDKVLEVEYTYNLGMRDKELNYVVAEIGKTPPVGGIDAWKNAVEALMSYHRWDILAEETAKQKDDAHKRCQVCGAVGQEVTLVSDKPAYYCATHRVVIPKEVNKE